MKRVLLLLFVIFSLIGKGKSNEITINSAWEFLQNDTLDYHRLESSQQWEWVNLPHTWNREDVLDEKDGYKRGIGWYRKNMVIPSGPNQQIFLKFEGANQKTEVFVNDQKAGVHDGGYTAFVIDITEHVRFDEENEIVVKVDNRHNPSIVPLSADFSFYGGIYRDVWLVRKSSVHFDVTDQSCRGVYVNTPHVSERRASLKADVNIRNVTDEDREVDCLLKLTGPNQSVVDEKKVTLTVGPYENETAVLEMEVDNPELWSPGSPSLYTAEVFLHESAKGEILDQVMIKKGFRNVRMDENRGLVLNGDPLKLIGVNRHQDFEGYGNALPDQLHRNDIKKLKEMGANFIRIAHYPQDPAVLEACDELGILVWEEIPIVNYITTNDRFQRVSENMLKEMVRQHYNHTSVVMWGFMNEVLLRLNKGLDSNAPIERSEYLQQVNDLTRHLNDVAKAEDPSRWTAIAHHGNYDLYEEAGLNEITDVVGWNLYYGWYSENMSRAGDFLDRFHEDHPDKGIIIAEYGGGSDPRIRSVDPLRFDFSVEWQTEIHASYYRQMIERSHVMGGAIWNFADFSSEGRKDAVPHINSKGILNFDRSPKDSYLFYQAALSEEPYLEVGCLDWRHRAGFANKRGKLEHPVHLFSNAGELEVWLNSQNLGTYPVENYHLRILVPFEDGENDLLIKTEDGLSDKASFDVDVYPEDLRTLSPEEIDINVNFGAHFHFTDDVTGEIWLPERPYRKGSIGFVDGAQLMTWSGSRVGTDVEVFETGKDPLYQTHRDSISTFRADVPDGWYEVKLSFAEIYSEEAREKLAYNLGAESDELHEYVERAFGVRVNGNDILTVEDLEDFRATDYRFRVKAVDKRGLVFDFEEIRGSAFISAVSIRGL